MADVVVASQQGHRGRLSNPRLEAELPMLREQRGGDDMSAEQVVHGYVHTVSVRRHAEQDPLMLQRPDEALVPRALRVTEELPQFIGIDGSGSQVPKLVGEGRERRIHVLRKEPM